MSAIHFAKQAYSAFNRDKPHSSITEWVEILTASGYDEEAYDGIPELVDSINIQATGPAEASRALRKKLKHGDSHQQYRALVILRALVENGGHKFQTSFADNQLTDALRTLASDPTTDPKVKKKLVSVLASWHSQFKDDPSMSLVANMYNTVKPAQVAVSRAIRPSIDDDMYQIDAAGLGDGAEERRRREERERREKKEEEKRRAKEEEKRKAKEAKEAEKARLKKLGEEKRMSKGKPKRLPFNFDEEKPQIMTAIANATTASNNLVNAITLVNTEHDSLQTNERVQECLQKAKLARKQIVRYVQLVENEDMIGTLIESNDRIIAALETYDKLSKPTVSEADVTDVQNALAAAKIQDSELGKLQEKQRAAVQRSLGRASGQTYNGKEKATSDDDAEYSPSGRSGYVHPDLQDLNFGALGREQRGLPPPMRPSARTDEEPAWKRGSLSDFSDYSSDEDAHKRMSASAASASTSGAHAYRGYVEGSDDEEVDAQKEPKRALLDDADPFADPFVDQDDEGEVEGEGVGTPGIPQRRMDW